MLATTAQKLTKAIIIGIVCFFVGVLLAALSPLVAIMSIFYKPKPRKPLTDKWSKNLKTLEEKIKEIRDPDSSESWKKRHQELYGSEDE